MEICFLGTSSGAPSRYRNVSATALRPTEDKAWHLIDCGEGTQHRLIGQGFSLAKLDTLLITHVHGDHCLGLPGLLSSAALSGRTASLRIIAPRAIEDFIHAALALTASELTYPIEFIALEEQQGPVTLAGCLVEWAPLAHRVPSWAFAFTEHPLTGKLDTHALQARGIPAGYLWGRIARGRTIEWQGQVIKAEDFILTDRAPRRIIISGDNAEPERLRPLLPADLLVHEATYLQAQIDKTGEHHGHSSAAGIATFAAAAAVPHLALTHFSARYHTAAGIESLQQEAQTHYHGSLFMAEDWLRLRLNRDAQVFASLPTRAHNAIREEA